MELAPRIYSRFVDAWEPRHKAAVTLTSKVNTTTTTDKKSSGWLRITLSAKGYPMIVYHAQFDTLDQLKALKENG